MSNMIEDYNKVEAYTNLMLENYKNLVGSYEESRQIYEKIINSYKYTDIVVCSKIMADNMAWVTTKWQLIDIYGQVIYETGKYKMGQTYLIDLIDLGIIAQGTSMYLKASVDAGSDSESSVLIEYLSYEPNTAYFELTGTAFKTKLTYKGAL